MDSPTTNAKLPPEAWSRLICPMCRVPLARAGNRLRGQCGHSFPVVDGVPRVAAEYALPVEDVPNA